jgi:heme exporter protein D
MSQHTAFVVASYAIAILVIGGMALRIALDYRRLRDALARLGAAGEGDRGEGA